MMWARRRSLALVVVSYNWRSSVTWVLDKGGRDRGVAIVPFSKDGQPHTTPSLYRKYFLEAFRQKSRSLSYPLERGFYRVAPVLRSASCWTWQEGRAITSLPGV